MNANNVKIHTYLSIHCLYYYCLSMPKIFKWIILIYLYYKVEIIIIIFISVIFRPDWNNNYKYFNYLHIMFIRETIGHI